MWYHVVVGVTRLSCSQALSTLLGNEMTQCMYTSGDVTGGLEGSLRMLPP